MGDSTLEEVSVSVVNQNYHQISVDILFLRQESSRACSMK